MMTSLALMAGLMLPSQGGLNLTNGRYTYGELGPVRASDKFLPGDIVFLCFDIENLKPSDKPGEEGAVKYAMNVEVIDKAGKSVFKQPPAPPQAAFLFLGGNKLPARGFVSLDTEQEAGTYTLRVTVTDVIAATNKILDKTFQVLPKEFGLVGVFTAFDEAANLAAPNVGLTGQALWVHFGVVGFSRSPEKQPNVAVQMSVLDAQGAPTLNKPYIRAVTKLDEKAGGIPLGMLVPLNRPGQFTIAITATDKLTNKTVEFKLPIAVGEAPK